MEGAVHTSHSFFVRLLLTSAASGFGAHAATATKQRVPYTVQANAPADAAYGQTILSTKSFTAPADLTERDRLAWSD
jgi:hypothetical protein